MKIIAQNEYQKQFQNNIDSHCWIKVDAKKYNNAYDSAYYYKCENCNLLVFNRSDGIIERSNYCEINVDIIGLGLFLKLSCKEIIMRSVLK